MRILALIIARGGSKRLPGKNIRKLGARPLIVWSLDAAKGIPEICDILVSTDDTTIADVARGAGGLVPWLRPAELATDSASSLDASIHALDWYETVNGPVDGVLLLQPTSPFRRRKSILRGIELFRANNLRPVVGVSRADSHPLWCFKIVNDVLRPYIDGAGLRQRSQDLPPAYVVNGSFYLIAPRVLRQERSFFSEDMAPLVTTDAAESIDIDSESDWEFAEYVLARNDPSEMQ
jgi:CMP-N,N'-diacetyllegionaminic acid synthase